jgi:hypothetical protein
MACALVATILLTGCHATTDARWTTANDTVYRWEHAMPTLPVEVRGQLPTITNAQIAQAIPRALPARQPADQTAARLVVDAGNDLAPTNDAYCAATESAPAAATSRTPLALTLSLCDGPRLVASSRSQVAPGKTHVDDLPRQIDRLKNLMLIGIDESPAQYVHIQG